MMKTTTLRAGKSLTLSLIILISILFLPVKSIYSQTCDGPYGLIELVTQAQVDNFNCSAVANNLTINGSDITNLDGLSELTHIGGILTIKNNPNLTNLNGLSALTGAYAVNIHNNAVLKNLDGLAALSGPASDIMISITGNPQLISIDGLSNLGSVWSLSITNNSSLARFCGVASMSGFYGGPAPGVPAVNISGNMVNPTLSEIYANGTCAEVFQINGDGFQSGTDCYTLTPASNYKSGSVWAPTRVNLYQKFEFYGSIYLGCREDNGADGIAFVMQEASSTALGSAGEGQGYEGIGTSIAVEFDTYHNYNRSDPASDHIALLSNGSVSHNVATNLAGPVQMLVAGANAEDCNSHDLIIKWNPEVQKLRVYVDGSLRLMYQGDIINNIFGGRQFVYWGFTGATGASYNVQEICINSVLQTEEGDNTFTLVDATSDLDIGPLQSGDVLDVATLGTDKLAIRANLAGPDVTSVRFSFQNIAKYRIENFAPYALHGDDSGDYDEYIYTPGAYTVSATPYDRRNAKGNKGEKHTVKFTVIDSNPGARLSAESALKVYPSPFSNKITVDLKQTNSDKISLEVYNLNGSQVFLQTIETHGQALLQSINLMDAPVGMYILRVIDGETVFSERIVKQ